MQNTVLHGAYRKYYTTKYNILKHKQETHTEIGFIGIQPYIAENYQVTVLQAGWLIKCPIWHFLYLK